MYELQHCVTIPEQCLHLAADSLGSSCLIKQVQFVTGQPEALLAVIPMESRGTASPSWCSVLCPESADPAYEL